MSPADAGPSIWTVIEVMSGVMVATVTISGYIIRLMISNAVIRLEARIDAIDIATLRNEIAYLRDWKHEVSNEIQGYKGYDHRIRDLELSRASTSVALSTIGLDVAVLKQRGDGHEKR